MVPVIMLFPAAFFIRSIFRLYTEVGNLVQNNSIIVLPVSLCKRRIQPVIPYHITLLQSIRIYRSPAAVHHLF